MTKKTPKLARVKRGSKPTLASAEKANEIIQWLNCIGSVWRIVPDGAGSVSIGDDGIVIDLTPLIERINSIEKTLGESPISKSFAVACGGRIKISIR